MLYPNGNSNEKGKSLSMYLQLEGSETVDSGKKLHTEYILRVIDQLSGVHHEQKGEWHHCENVFYFRNFVCFIFHGVT